MKTPDMDAKAHRPLDLLFASKISWSQISTAGRAAPFDESRTADEVDFSYQSLDIVSDYVEGIGVERPSGKSTITLWPMSRSAQMRIHGHWEVNTSDWQPSVLVERCMILMPINVVWDHSQARTCEPANRWC